MKRRVGRLANANPQGRLDVLLYQLANRGLERIERDQGLSGLREHLLPIVHDAILANVPGTNLIPREIAALLRVVQINQGRIP